ncbi:hypothetical protein FRZ03_07760 [Streptomyces misionensis]|uniref:Uncharacterized protein n=1 Tax=Streptomyces misionensis TaxID=67331 RepID=A0A5C6JXK8_9ACTN|nr:hypothetical protein [Streptomyces misionensis]TWV55420.1 hypothetical protein FRZ03_07760 [Streptomyces misionensis]
MSRADDLGVDGDGIGRDRPPVSWAPDLGDGDAGSRVAVESPRKRWSERGRKVTTEPGTDPVIGAATGLQELRTAGDHGVTLSPSPGRRSGEGRIVADGGCDRHDGYGDTKTWSFL